MGSGALRHQPSLREKVGAVQRKIRCRRECHRMPLDEHTLADGVDVNVRRRAIPYEVGLSHGAGPADVCYRPGPAYACTLLGGGAREERCHRSRGRADAAKQGSEDKRLAQSRRTASRTERRPRSETSLEDEMRLGPKEGRSPEDDVGDLSRLEGTDLVRNAVYEGRVNRYFRQIAEDAFVVAPFLRSCHLLHDVGELPGSSCRLTDASHPH